MTPQDLINVAWMVWALFIGAVVGLPLASLAADWLARGFKPKSAPTSTRPKGE